MTVKDLEDTLEMSRANIRFYEREGLLSPTRLANGYRDYSQEDLAALRKIKLLRRLRCDLEDIRAVQRGERDLTNLLREREKNFDSEKADLEAARTLCRRMEEEGARYDDMDAPRYLAEMDRLTQEGIQFPTLQADALPTLNHPWVRYFARGLDLGLCTFLLYTVLLLGFRAPAPVMGSSLALLAVGYVAWLMLLGLEPLLLCTWGWTPGKWIFGLKLRDGEKKLTFSAAWNRLSGVFGRGEGYNVPIYALYRNWKSYSACAEGEVLPWDEGLTYTMEDRRALGGVIYVLSRGAMLFLVFLMAANTLFPLEKTPLTVASFARSYNDIARQLNPNSPYQLDAAGGWMRPGNRYGLEPARFRYTLEGDRLTAVSAEETEPNWYGTGSWESTLMVTLLGAGREIHLLSWLGVVRALPEQLGASSEPWSMTYYGITVTNEVTYSGYEKVGDGYLLPIEGEQQHYHRLLTVVLAAEP